MAPAQTREADQSRDGRKGPAGIRLSRGLERSSGGAADFQRGGLEIGEWTAGESVRGDAALLGLLGTSWGPSWGSQGSAWGYAASGSRHGAFQDRHASIAMLACAHGAASTDYLISESVGSRVSSAYLLLGARFSTEGL